MACPEVEGSGRRKQSWKWSAVLAAGPIAHHVSWIARLGAMVHHHRRHQRAIEYQDILSHLHDKESYAVSPMSRFPHMPSTFTLRMLVPNIIASATPIASTAAAMKIPWLLISCLSRTIQSRQHRRYDWHSISAYTILQAITLADHQTSHALSQAQSYTISCVEFPRICKRINRGCSCLESLILV